MSDERTHFRLCSSCKKPLPFEGRYYVCSVSTCNRKRTGLTFCSLPCFEAHVPVARHREAWAEERRAPSRAEWERELAQEREREQDRERQREQDRERRRVVGVGAAGEAGRAEPEAGGVELSDDVPRDVLVVVSKLKAYIKARAGMKTSDTLLEPLSDIIRQIADDAIERAAADGRKTVMDRDL
ncbi:MAG: hypothetical protein PVI30_14065 [Myxococcales bacterium]|jgi:hypothetical protein